MLTVLSEPDIDARVVEGFSWVVQAYASQLNLPEMIRIAVSRNIQNRLGFLFELSEAPGVADAVLELEKVRLPEEATMCWDSMPEPFRVWVRNNRTAIAERWNMLTRLRRDQLYNAA